MGREGGAMASHSSSSCFFSYSGQFSKERTIFFVVFVYLLREWFCSVAWGKIDTAKGKIDTRCGKRRTISISSE
jgi:hypothetical protein